MVQGQIGVAVVSRRPEFWPRTAEQIIRQLRRPEKVALYPHLEYGSEVEVKYMQNRADAFRDEMLRAGIDFLQVHHQAGTPYGGAMHATAEVLAARLEGDGLICKFDDDDFYGPRYLLHAEACLAQDPDALLIGKAGFWTVFMDCKREPMFWTAPTNPQLEASSLTKVVRTRYLGGPTICIPTRAYRAHPTLRYPADKPFGIDDMLVRRAREIHENWVKQFMSQGLVDNSWPPIYSTGTGEFQLQRWLDPAHDHVWKPPELMTERVQ